MIEDFRSCGDGHLRFHASKEWNYVEFEDEYRYSRLLKVQNLKMSTGTQNPVPVLKVIKSAEEDEYRYSRVLKVQRKMSTSTGCVSTSTEK